MARRVLLSRLAARLLLAGALLAAGWFGWSWYAAASSGPSAADQLRDQVLQIAEQAAINVSSLSYHHLAPGIRLWKQSATGTFLAGIIAGQAQLEHAVSQARTVTTARVLDGALTSLRPSAGEATFIVAELTTVTTPTGKPSVTQYRLQGQLTRTAAGWKLSSLRVVPTGAASGTTGTGG
jgi:Mce-associated membrane protein